MKRQKAKPHGSRQKQAPKRIFDEGQIAHKQRFDSLLDAAIGVVKKKVA